MTLPGDEGNSVSVSPLSGVLSLCDGRQGCCPVGCSVGCPVGCLVGCPVGCCPDVLWVVVFVSCWLLSSCQHVVLWVVQKCENSCSAFWQDDLVLTWCDLPWGGDSL